MRLAILLALWPAAVVGQDFPALYNVAGISSDDVLNIRAEPNAGAEIVSTLAHDATNVEVTGAAPLGGWLRVNVAENTGWISETFVIRSGPDWSNGLPERLACYGTEPFWGFEDIEGTATFSLPLEDVETPWNRINPGREAVPIGLQPVQFSAVYYGEIFGVATAAIRRESCGDGMSDREMGMSILLTVVESDGISIYAGCCSLAP